SLLAVQLFARIKSSLGRNLPMASLFEAPTIAQMARILQQSATAGAWGSLRAIKPEGDRPPLFLVPGIGGDVIVYHELAPLLAPEQRAYGLQPPGLDGIQKPIQNMAKLAAHLVKEIRALQKHGPYYLGGLCVGGVVAFEMAHQLIAAGEDVALLALFETWPPSVHRAGVIPQFMPPFLNVPIALGNGIARLPGALLRARPKQWLSHLRGRLRSAHEIVAGRNVYEADTAGLYTGLVSRATYWAMYKYFPRIYPGRIVLFIASDRPLVSRPDGRLLWRKLAKYGCQIYYAGGNDSSAMLKRPHVELIARHLAQEIERAAAERESESRVLAPGSVGFRARGDRLLELSDSKSSP
ncbi:MAG: thioesterase domain-containing protein, partial [Chloroflexota bacterium]